MDLHASCWLSPTSEATTARPATPWVATTARLPGRELGQQVVDGARTRAATLRQGLAVDAAGQVLPRGQRRLLLGELLGDVAGGHALPLTGVDLAQALVVADLQAASAASQRAAGPRRAGGR